MKAAALRPNQARPLNAMHPGSVQAAMKARYDSLQELLDGTLKQVVAITNIEGLKDAHIACETFMSEQFRIIAAYEVYTGETWDQVKEAFGIKDEES